MKQEDIHNELNTEDKDFMKSLPKVELPYSRSKEDVWEQMEALINEEAEEKIQLEVKVSKSKQLRPLYYSVAAVLVVLLSTTAFMRLYTKTVNATAGQHLTALLPDGSSIELNAGSVIKYKPYWWRFNREVQFEGEGFFKVQKGQSFEVTSSLGRTIVLGTSFNIYARKHEYKVTCYTGKVRVVSVVSGNSADITPNMQAVVKNGTVNSYNEVNTSEVISWVNDMFIFTGTPVKTVFEEIERQYGVKVISNDELNYLYTGNFTRNRSANDVVKMVCRSLGLSYQHKNDTFVISK